ncbi:ABC transporter substrate-binding protein [Planosporangium thailandense]|uniref:ABC transporter substrate-binding protein n=1 Tax=Planosporangium thailandense TaxID=765197 RepID=A0ABX0XU76_9ACTN|nr:ABC transporter substrate-binding protein [Planosporangium thailandense]NJC68980.1 ABC transporter substrate-binding protein [Planosporangium thailandense]
MRRVTRTALTFAALTAVLFASACGTSKPSDSAGSAGHRQTRLYGTDGNMSSSFGDLLKDTPGVLAGMKGTTPLTPLTDEFKRRLHAVDPTLTDYNYAGESYDAVIVSALAAEAARSTDAPAIAKYIVGTTVGGTTCSTFKDCVGLIRQNENIQYRGVSSLKRSGFTDVGEPSTASYATLNFGRDNHIDDAKTEFVGAGEDTTAGKNEPTPPPASANRTGKPTALKFGGLLPHTGALASQGPPMFAGGKLAVQEINEAGGVLGQPVEWVDGDDGTSPQVASATVDRFISAGVQVIIGAAASGVSAAVLPKVVAASRILFSPSATSEALSTVDDKGLFFRTAPSDKLQAKALADIVMRDGAAKVAVVARDDSYGKGLSSGVLADLTTAGLKAGNIQVLTYKGKETYAPGDRNTLFKPLAKTIAESGPDAVVIIGFDESALFVRALKDEGMTFQS